MSINDQVVKIIGSNDVTRASVTTLGAKGAVATELLDSSGNTVDLGTAVSLLTTIDQDTSSLSSAVLNAKVQSDSYTKRKDTAASTATADGGESALISDALGHLWIREGYASGAEDNSNNVIATQNKPLAVSTYAWSADVSAALEASTISKAAAGVLRSATIRVDSTHATATYYIHFYNSATLPADGAVTFLCAPYKIQHITGTDTRVTFDFTMNGIYASAGIVMALSTTEFTKTISGAFTSSTILFK